MLSIQNYHSRTKLLLVISFLLAATFFGVNKVSAQQKVQICPIDGIPASEIILDDLVVGGNSLSGEILLVNTSEYNLPGIKVGVGVYTDKNNEVPDFWTVLPNDYLLLPQEQKKEKIEIDISFLPKGDYVIRTFVSQGENEVLAMALRDYEYIITDSFSKSSDAILSSTQEVKLNGQLETFVFDTGIELVIDASLSGDFLTDSSSKIIVNRDYLPLGDSVYIDLEESNSKLTVAEDLPDGNFSIYTYQKNEGTLLPLTRTQIAVGETKQNYYSIYPYISALGTTAHPISDGSEAVVCVGFYSPDGVRVSATTKQIAIDFQVTDEEGNVIDSKKQQTPRFDNFAKFSLNSIRNDSMFNAVLSTERNFDVQTEEADYSPVQTVSFGHKCGDVCNEEITETIVDFTSNETVKYSFWFYAGIVLSSLLLMFLVLRRLDPQPEVEDYKSPDEMQ